MNAALEDFIHSTPDLSVILCTHNPRPDYLARVLEGLRLQSLPRSRWELIVIDSASHAPLASSLDLSWHDHACVLREEESGHLRARLRGIEQATGALLVFVDDDNVLNPDYLVQSLAISREHPLLGVWGGSAIGDYEQSPPPWFKPYEHVLSVREITRDAWSNVPVMDKPWVIGAGMVVRHELAVRYANLVKGDARRFQLGRKGSSIMGADDLDFILSICDQGFGRGVFQSLRLSHLIPLSRSQSSYLWNLAKCNTASMELIRYFRGEGRSVSSPGVLKSLWLKIKESRLPHHRRMYYQSLREGIKLAEQIIRDDLAHGSGHPSSLGIKS